MLTISNSAKMFLRDQLYERGPFKGIRLRLKKSGCSGFSYLIEEVMRMEKLDTTIYSDGIRIFCSQMDLEFFEDTSIDLEFKNLTHQIVLKNPKMINSCGCGESFEILGQSASIPSVIC